MEALRDLEVADRHLVQWVVVFIQLGYSPLYQLKVGELIKSTKFIVHIN